MEYRVPMEYSVDSKWILFCCTPYGVLPFLIFLVMAPLSRLTLNRSAANLTTACKDVGYTITEYVAVCGVRSTP